MIETQGAEKTVTMTCCNSRYATVAQTLGHECPADDAKLFSSILKRERQVDDTKWTVMAHATGLISSAYRGGVATDRMAEDRATLHTTLEQRQAELFRDIDALTPTQLHAYGEYRKTH